MQGGQAHGCPLEGKALRRERPGVGLPGTQMDPRWIVCPPSQFPSVLPRIPLNPTLEPKIPGLESGLDVSQTCDLGHAYLSPVLHKHRNDPVSNEDITSLKSLEHAGCGGACL